MFINNTSSGHRFTVDISGEDTIRTLKTRITDEVGVAPSHQQLTFNGAELKKNDATLASYGIDPSLLKPQ